MNAKDLDQFNFSSYTGLNAQLIAWRYEALTPYFYGDSCLELGSSDGQGTTYLARAFKHVVAVDGSQVAIKELERRFAGQNVEAVCHYFESLELHKRFDTVILAHVMEHVDDPAVVLEVAQRHLSPGGRIIADVPNALSIHRQVGVKLGMMQAETEINEADRSIGHQRVYTPEVFRDEFVKAGFTIIEFGGFFLKPLSNGQMEELFEMPVTKALFEIGAKYPELAAEIFVVAGRD
jgi:2-polyprenyl-3-methyl-5-hydroxy-6-metoxy-1,4-benzoquinol methylase